MVPDELTSVAELAAEHDAYLVCDEVYEHVVFDGRPHVPLITLPGMRERCVKIGSAGKTFSLTGWKIGYMTAAPELLQPIAKAHQFLTYTSPPNLQRAVAYGLGKGDDYFAGLASFMEARRDLLAEGLRGLGLPPLECQGTYFLNVDLGDVDLGRVDLGAAAGRSASTARRRALPVARAGGGGRAHPPVRLLRPRRDRGGQGAAAAPLDRALLLLQEDRDAGRRPGAPGGPLRLRRAAESAPGAPRGREIGRQHGGQVAGIGAAAQLPGGVHGQLRRADVDGGDAQRAPRSAGRSWTRRPGRCG